MPPAGFGRFGRRVCGVKVKLTMWLAFGRQQVVSAHSITSKVFLQGSLSRSQGGCKQVWLSRGEGWGSRAKRPVQGEGGLLRPSLFLCEVNSAWASAVRIDEPQGRWRFEITRMEALDPKAGRFHQIVRFTIEMAAARKALPYRREPVLQTSRRRFFRSVLGKVQAASAASRGRGPAETAMHRRSPSASAERLFSASRRTSDNR
jgi:hypothetical protein